MARLGDWDDDETFWRRVLRQWQRSGQGARSYCDQQGLSAPSFSAWRRIIAARDQQAMSQTRGDQAPSRQGRRRGSTTPLFVPVRVTPTVPATLEVVLRDGRLIRVPADFDAAALRQLLTVLAETPSC